jgi:hypothetical protein
MTKTLTVKLGSASGLSWRRDGPNSRKRTQEIQPRMDPPSVAGIRESENAESRHL